MSDLPGVKEALSLVERFRSTVRELAREEAELAAGFAAQFAAVEQVRATALRRLEERSSADEAARRAEYEQAAARFRAIHAARQRLIEQGLLADRRRATQRVDQEESRRKYRVQEGALRAERRRESDTAAAEARLAEVRQRCLEAEERAAQMGAEAARVFRGDRALIRLLDREWPVSSAAPDADEESLFGEAEGQLSAAGAALDRFQHLRLSRVFAAMPLWLWFLVAALGAATAGALPHFGFPGLAWRDAAIAFGGAVVAVTGLFLLARRQALPLARATAEHLAGARRALALAKERAEQRHRDEQGRIEREYEQTTARLREEWSEAVERAEELRARYPRELDAQAHRASARNDAQLASRLAMLQARAAAAGTLSAEAQLREQERIEAEFATAKARIAADEASALADYDLRARQKLSPLLAALGAANEAVAREFPAWSDPAWQAWEPPATFRNAAPFGRLEIEVERLCGGELTERRFRAELPAMLSVPLLLSYPNQGSLLFETGEEGGAEAVATMNNVIYRLLSATPPGKLSFTIIDPVGLGQSFAGLMRLADFDENNINGRIWTQTAQIEERLAELGEHMEKVIQMYLRDEYATIADYNAAAGVIAEKYHVLVIAGFPVNFSEAAARRLLNIAASGARCGVFTLIQWDRRQPLPHDWVAEELRRQSVRVVGANKVPTLADAPWPGARLILDPPPPPEFTGEFLRRVGERSRGANRVEVAFAQVAPPPEAFWSLDTTEEIRVPIGRAGATKLQYFALGRGTRQHALVAGKTGSGKSTFFHVLITNLASWCSPAEVEFYLVDFKKGVEFKGYATRKLPHARVVAIESDRDFGLSVLQRVDDELRRRGDRFRARGVQDLAGYRRATGESLPRTLLIIDEFQEFFTEEDRISQSAAVLLDRIVRQGRAFGIHVLLGSQTLGGAYTLARATLGQMVVRIALQCNEADAYLIMDENNPAPRLLSRPGEGIYNDAGGAPEGNSPFQTVWLPEDERDARLAEIRARAEAASARAAAPMVFEGNAPADVVENTDLAAVLEQRPDVTPPISRVWLGAPNSIKGPTEVLFRRQAGNNLLIVGQRDEAAFTLVCLALVALAAQHPVGSARFVVLDPSLPGSRERALLDRLIEAVPHPVTRPGPTEVPSVIRGLADEVKRRFEAGAGGNVQAPVGPGTNAPTTFVIIHGLQHYKRLRSEDDYGFASTTSDPDANVAPQFQELVVEGPANGVHVIATGDTWSNLGRFLGRKTLASFAWRVLFQMSANDSASLVDSPDASRLGLHRALLFHEPAGSLEIFRPYALPDAAWFDAVTGELSKRRQVAG
ncbi:MAG: ATP-binding protein [Verrucomicrobia bacterium]|nr:ATP-binding protein [Verrucomicrobiota bacterium]